MLPSAPPPPSWFSQMTRPEVAHVGVLAASAPVGSAGRTIAPVASAATSVADARPARRLILGMLQSAEVSIGRGGAYLSHGKHRRPARQRARTRRSARWGLRWRLHGARAGTACGQGRTAGRVAGQPRELPRLPADARRGGW